ncbi:MAG: diacylglycerol kinase [Alphaproteobacteria bacterium]|nr:diacylglycerol kinase [Alphaproteobacteria bacterium]MBX9977853.1 diacylglycerol kinase [Alphaproteobacteria bacterium]
MRLFKAFLYSMNGLKEAYMREAAIRLEIYLLIIALSIIFFTPLNSVEQSILILSYGIVIITELLNTAIEKAIDRISLEDHPMSKIVKDIASAAVFISVSLCVIVWLLVLLPKFL